jgi:hypothetical protein
MAGPAGLGWGCLAAPHVLCRPGHSGSAFGERTVPALWWPESPGQESLPPGRRRCVPGFGVRQRVVFSLTPNPGPPKAPQR